MKALDIIERLKVELRVSNERQLAQRLGIPIPTVYEWKRMGRIPPGGIARIAVSIGRSVEWVRTGQPSALEAASRLARELDRVEEVPTYLRAPSRQMERFVRIMEGFPVMDQQAMGLLAAVAEYIKEGTHPERDTIRRLLRGLKASPEVRAHLVGQLKLIDRLIDAEQPPREDKAADPPPRAKAG